MTERYKSFSEFWPYYVSEHSHPGTRLLHLIGTVSGLVVMIYLIAIGRWYLFLLGLIPGYGCAWLGHFLIEKNKPATFQYPLWSLASDARMYGLWLTGRLDAELRKAGVAADRR